MVDLNRAVALAMLFGPAAGLELIDKLTLEPALKATRNERERKLLLARVADCVRN